MSTAGFVADGLADEGFDVRDPIAENSQFLKVTNARHAYCEIVISEKDAVSWEYRSFDGGIGPDQISGMVLAILGAGGARDHASLSPRPGSTLKETVGAALRERGIRVGTWVVDPYESGDGYAEIRAENPAKPDRGSVHVSDEGMILWECRVRGLAVGDDHGMSPGEVAQAIAGALQIAERAA